MNFDAKKNPIKITVAGDLLAGSGVGASAASCVSLARALNAEFDLGYLIEEINRVAWQGEFPYHGIASGVDNTASTYGGLLRFWLQDGKQNFEQIKTPSSFEIVLCNSGITANTAALDDFIDEQKKESPMLFRSRLDTIMYQGSAMKQALEAGDLETVGRIMTENHRLLVNMEMSHEILDFLCKVALKNGALGAKVTGGGRGGYGGGGGRRFLAYSKLKPKKRGRFRGLSSFFLPLSTTHFSLRTLLSTTYALRPSTFCVVARF